MKNNGHVKISFVSTDLLSEGKSSRLMAIRKKISGADDTKTELNDDSKDDSIDLNMEVKAEWMRARAVIDHVLAEIMKNYPPDKRARFFAIRFGMSIDQLKQHSIKDIFSLLAIREKEGVNMKMIANLDYNGRFTP